MSNKGEVPAVIAITLIAHTTPRSSDRHETGCEAHERTGWPLILVRVEEVVALLVVRRSRRGADLDWLTHLFQVGVKHTGTLLSSY